MRLLLFVYLKIVVRTVIVEISRKNPVRFAG